MVPLLTIRNLRTCFETTWGTVWALAGIDLEVEKGETLGVVGESGCGKTVLALSILRLVPRPAGRIVAGEIVFDGVDLLGLDEEAMRTLRGREISMIFQEPMNSLNPVFTVGDQIAEVLTLHRRMGAKEAGEMTVELLARVGIPDARKRVRDYPHQLSGGQRQRVMIAMALACRPRLLLADEPTTALDVTVQAQILALLENLQEETGTAVVLITHDLGVVAQTARRVAVMYAGQIVEEGPVEAIFSRPMHPYTIGLLSSIPPVDRLPGKDERLKGIGGTVPTYFSADLKGCRFLERCPWADEGCRDIHLALSPCGDGHYVRCRRAP